MENIIKFVLTEWNGAPLAIWLALIVAGLVIFIVAIVKSTRIRVTAFGSRFDYEQKPPQKRKRPSQKVTKPKSTEDAPKPKKSLPY
jgi:hypothetical protein